MRHGKLVVVTAIAAFVGATLAWLGRDERARQVAFPAYSVHDTSDEGLSLAHGYLVARGVDVGILTRPVSQAHLPADAVLLRVGPRRQFGDAVRSMTQEETRPRRKGGKHGKDAESEKDGGTDEERRRAEEARVKKELERQQAELRRVIDGIFGEDDEKEDEKPTDPEDVDADDGGAGDDAEGDGDEGPRFDVVTLLDPAEDAWVSGGGRLVLAIDRTWGPLSVRDEKRELVKVHPSWPGVRELHQEPARVVLGRSLASGHALFARGDASVVHRIPSGRGEILVLSCPEVLRNDGIGAGDHLALLEALVGRGRSVVFDERIHGTGTEAGLLELLRGWGLGPLLLLGALAGVVAFWRGVARLGPPADDHRESRTEAVDLVDSVAVLYGRALTREDGLVLYRRELERQVTLRTDLRGDALHARVRDLIAGASAPGDVNARNDAPLPGDDAKGGAAFARRLRQLNDAFGRLDTHHAHRP